MVEGSADTERIIYGGIVGDGKLGFIAELVCGLDRQQGGREIEAVT